MDRLWENSPENDWYDYVNKVRKLNFAVGGAFLLFGISEFVAIVASLFYSHNVLDTMVFSLAGIGFSLMFLYVMYRVEKVARKFTISFSGFIRRGIYLSVVLIASVPYFLVIVLPVLPYNSLYLFLGVTFAYLGTVVVLTILNRISRYGFKLARSLDNEEIEKGLKETAEYLQMDYIQPMVTNGKEIKMANAYCSGLFKHKIWITDYLLENLEIDEVVSVLSHEYTHAKYNHNAKIAMPIFTAYLIFAIMVVYSLISHIIILYSLFYLIGVAFLPYILYLPRTRLELRADRIASRAKSSDITVSALEKIYRLNLVLPNRGSLTHPSLDARIKKLRKNGN